MEFEFDPDQPDAVVRAVRELLGAAAPPPDPWWQAGVDEVLNPAGDPSWSETPGGCR